MIKGDRRLESKRTKMRLHENVAVAPNKRRSPMLNSNCPLTDRTRKIPKKAIILPAIIRFVIFSLRKTAASPAVIKGAKLKINEAFVAEEYFKPVNKKTWFAANPITPAKQKSTSSLRVSRINDLEINARKQKKREITVKLKADRNKGVNSFNKN